MALVGTIEGVMAFFLLVALIYGPWQWICTDIARQAMFKERDKLFDMARVGDLDFTSSEYREIRDGVNSMIRFAHSLTWVRMIVFARFSDRPRDQKIPIYAAINRIKDKSKQEIVRSSIARIELAAIYMLLLKSPMLVLLGIVTVIPAAIALTAWVFAKDFLSKVAQEVGILIQSEAASLGR